MIASIPLPAIEMDTSIQCRASIDTAVVNDYAERMTEGDKFPPVDLFGATQFWIGDGWHRVMAAKQIGALTIETNVHEGARRDALKFALGANAAHGHRRTNADKRRSVEIALLEFADLSSRALGELCAVDHTYVLRIKNEALGTNTNASAVTTTDGRQYPAKRITKAAEKALANEQRPLPRGTSRQQIVAAVLELHETGHNREQIAQRIGRSPQAVADYMNDAGLTKAGGHGADRTRKSIDVPRLIQETVAAVEATSIGLRIVRNGPFNIPAEDAASMLTQLREGMKSLRWLEGKLKELANG